MIKQKSTSFVDVSKIVNGQRVMHRRFGEGTITLVIPQNNGPTMMNVEFDEGMKKTFQVPLVFDNGSITLIED